LTVLSRGSAYFPKIPPFPFGLLFSNRAIETLLDSLPHQRQEPRPNPLRSFFFRFSISFHLRNAEPRELMCFPITLPFFFAECFRVLSFRASVLLLRADHQVYHTPNSAGSECVFPFGSPFPMDRFLSPFPRFLQTIATVLRLSLFLPLRADVSNRT